MCVFYRVNSSKLRTLYSLYILIIQIGDRYVNKYVGLLQIRPSTPSAPKSYFIRIKNYQLSEKRDKSLYQSSI